MSTKIETTPKMPFRLLPMETRTGFANMAIDEAILQARSEGKAPNTLRFYKWSPTTASIGRLQSLNDEVDLSRARALGVDVVRRISGGGAVLHVQDDEITYSIVVDKTDLAMRLSTARISSLLARGLMLGVEKYGARPKEGVIHCPAIFLDGKKISGNAQARRKEIFLQHGTLLLDVDPEFMYSILKAPTGVSKSKMVRSVRAKVTGLRKNVPDLREHSLVQYLIEGFSLALNAVFEPGILTDYERMLVEKLESKYSGLEWLTKYE